MEGTMALWTARELARITEIPTPTVSYWVNAGLITPSQYGRGRGGHKIGVLGLIELLTIIELRASGVSLRDIRRAVENLRQISGERRPLASLTLVVVDDDILWIDGEELNSLPVSALRKPGQRVLIFPIGEKHTLLIQKLGYEQLDSNWSDTLLVSGHQG